MSETITRADIITSIVDEIGTSRTQASVLLESVLETVMGALMSGDSVKITHFGTFTVRQKTARIGRNPRTGKEAKITPRRVILFRASPTLKEAALEK